MRNARAMWATLLAAVCMGLLLAACGSGSSDSSTSASNTTTGSSSTAAGESESPSGEPLKVGFFMVSSGSGANAQVPLGEQAALENINSNGGIGGRPLELEICQGDGSPEKDISCANQFAENHVMAVMDGFDFAFDGALPVLKAAGIPIVGAFAQASQANEDKSTFYLGPAQQDFGVGSFQVFQEEGLNKVSLVTQDIPASHAYIEGAVIPSAEALGIDFTPIYYPPNSPNFSTIAATIISSEPDIGGTASLPDENQCTSMVKALREQGYENAIFAGFCTKFIEEVGAEAKGTQIYTTVWLPQMQKYAPADIQKELETATTEIEGQSNADAAGFYSYATYSLVKTFADVVGEIKGQLSPTTIRSAFANLKGHPSALGAAMTCNRQAWPGTSACSGELMVAEVQEDGSLKPIGGGFVKVKVPPQS